MKTTILTALLVPSLLACGGDVVNYSAPVGITFSVKSTDAAGTSPYAFSQSKNINTEQGNPYGAFVNQATRALGRAPSRITANYVALELLGTSKVVTNLDQVASQVGVGFELVGATVTPVASTASAPVGAIGAGFPMATSFDSASLDATAYSALLGGSFPVVLGGDAIASFPTAGATADLQVTFGFVAYK